MRVSIQALKQSACFNTGIGARDKNGWQSIDCHPFSVQKNLLSDKLLGAFSEVKLFNVPELAVGGRVHDEVAHVRPGGGQFEAQI